MRSLDDLGLQLSQVNVLAHQSHRFLIEIAGEVEAYVTVGEAQGDGMAVDRMRDREIVGIRIGLLLQVNQSGLGGLVEKREGVLTLAVLRVGHLDGEGSLNLDFDSRSEKAEQLISVHPMGHPLERNVPSL